MPVWRCRLYCPHGVRRAKEDGPLLPLHELVAVLALTAVPLFVAVMAKTVTGAYYDRYAIIAVLGCAFGFAVLACRHARGCPLVGTFIVLACLY